MNLLFFDWNVHLNNVAVQQVLKSFHYLPQTHSGSLCIASPIPASSLISPTANPKSVLALGLPKALYARHLLIHFTAHSPYTSASSFHCNDFSLLPHSFPPLSFWYSNNRNLITAPRPQTSDYVIKTTLLFIRFAAAERKR